MKDKAYGLHILVANVTNLVATYLQLLPNTQCVILAYFTYKLYPLL